MALLQICCEQVCKRKINLVESLTVDCCGNGEWNETSKVSRRYFKAGSNEGKMMPTRGFFLLAPQGLLCRSLAQVGARIVNIAALLLLVSLNCAAAQLLK